MGIELGIEAVEFRRDAHQDQEGRAHPPAMPEGVPLLRQHEFSRQRPPNGDQRHEAFGHERTGGTPRPHEERPAGVRAMRPGKIIHRRHNQAR